MTMDLLKDPKTVDRILDSLSGICGELPQEGFLAGGSVANFIHSMVYGGKPCVNDIDIFEIHDSYQWKEDKLSNEPYREVSLTVMCDGYSRTYVTPKGYYKILDATRDGVFNYVNVHVTQVEQIDSNLMVLEGFDLNCCQAGIDLKTRELVYTYEFEQFIKTNQLKVLVPYTPLHTSIRIFKKIGELNCYCDVDKEMRLLSQVPLIMGEPEKTSSYCGVVSDIYVEKFEIYKDKLEKYMELIPYKSEDTLSIYASKGDTEGDKNLHTFKFKEEYSELIVKESVSSVLELYTIWELMYRSRPQKEIRKIKKILDSVSKREVKPKISGIFSMDVSEFKEKEINYCFLMNMSNLGYHRCDFDYKNVKYINDFFKEHPRSFMALSQNVQTLREHYEIIRYVKSMSNKMGGFIIGMLETMGEERPVKTTIEWITSYLEGKKSELSGKLTDKMNITDFDGHEYIRELTTGLDLLTEGHQMNHCVGGYSSSVSSGNSKIFSINVNGSRSTLEVYTPKKYSNKNPYLIPTYYYNENGEKTKEDYTTPRFRLSQHYGHSNSTPSDENKELVNRFIKYLDERHLNVEIQSYKVEYDLEKYLYPEEW
jgi:hypothetical protein